MEFLELEFNHLIGTIPPFNNLERLQYINLMGNNLTSTIPTSIGSPNVTQFINLGGLNNNDNKLIGPISDSYCNYYDLVKSL